MHHHSGLSGRQYRRLRSFAHRRYQCFCHGSGRCLLGLYLGPVYRSQFRGIGTVQEGPGHRRGQDVHHHRPDGSRHLYPVRGRSRRRAGRALSQRFRYRALLPALRRHRTGIPAYRRGRFDQPSHGRKHRFRRTIRPPGWPRRLPLCRHQHVRGQPKRTQRLRSRRFANRLPVAPPGQPAHYRIGHRTPGAAQRKSAGQYRTLRQHDRRNAAAAALGL